MPVTAREQMLLTVNANIGAARAAFFEQLAHGAAWLFQSVAGRHARAR